jgi:hypothetical protein
MDQFTISNRLRTTIFVLLGIGVLSLIMGVVMMMGAEGHESHHVANRVWGNVLINGLFFFGIALMGTFFMAVQYAAESAWAVLLKRIFEAVSQYVYVGAIVLIIVFAAGSLHLHHLYHWMDPAVTDPSSEHFDAIIAGKTAFLNQPFFWARVLVFIGVYVWFTRRFRQRSLEEDMAGGTVLHYNNVRDAAIFLVFFGFTSVVASWDWIMSIDTHWFSTLFGWYIFSGWWISAMVVFALLILYLKSKGYMPQVNENHIHDVGKWMFAVSFLWSYLFFSQFMLIWYSDIPEEVTYYIARIDHYRWLFWGMFIVNFVFPMLFLMDRDNKRNKGYLLVIGIIILLGHWADTFLLVVPGTQKADWHLGLFEIGLMLGFTGLFMFVVTRALTKAPLVVKSHPFLEESAHHEIH